MDYTKLNELKSQYGDYEEVFNSGDYDKAADILMKVLDVIELEYEDKRKAGMLDNDLNVRKSEGTDKYGCVLIILWNIIYMRAILSHRKKYLCQSFQLQNITGLMLIYA